MGKERILVTNLVPQELCSQLAVSEASTIFCWNMINGKCFDHTAGIVQTTIPQPLHLSNNGSVSFVQTRFFKHKGIGRFLNNLVDSIRVTKRARHYNNIWFYNVEWTQMLSFMLLRMMGKKIYVIVADFTPPKHFFSIATFAQYLFTHCKGIISLSSRTTFRHCNQASIAGIIPKEILEERGKTRTPSKHLFLFSGGLERIHGIDLAIDAFMDIPDAELIITGKKLLRDVSKFKNIHFKGYLSREEYEKLFKNVTCCISFRDPSFPENLNNFPSKIIEYMSYNKLILSTIKYPELSGLDYVYVDFDVEMVKESLRKITGEPPKNYEQSAKLQDKFSVERWKDTINMVENNTLRK